MRRHAFLAVAVLAVLTAGCLQYSDPRGRYEKPSVFKQAEALFLRGQYVQARAKFRQIYNSPRKHDRQWALEARFHAARCDQLTGMLSEAVAVYNEILKTPKYRRLEIRALAARADVMLDLGRYRLAEGDYGKARRLFEKSAWTFTAEEKRFIDREKLLFGEGMALWSQEKYAESDRVFDRYMADFPNGRFVAEAKAHHTKLGGKRPTVSFYVRVGGLYSARSLAEFRAREVRAKGFEAKLERRSAADGSAIYAVRVGAFDTRREAHAQLGELEAAGFTNCKVLP